MKFNSNVEFLIDIEKVFDAIFYSEKHQMVETEITNAYNTEENSDYNQNSKIVRQLTTQGNTQVDNIKYDFIKYLISSFINGDSLCDTGINTIYNTLIKEGFIKEIHTDGLQ